MITFQWDHEAPANLTYCLYEDGIKIVDNIEVMNFSLIMDGKAHKQYSYNVTAVDKTTKLESSFSNTVAIDYMLPKPPTNLEASWEE